VRDRRTLAIALLMGPLLMPALMLGMGKLVQPHQHADGEAAGRAGGRRQQRAQPGGLAAGPEHRVKPAPPIPTRRSARSAEDVILRIDGKFGEQWRGSMPARGRDPARLLAPGRADPGRALQTLLENYGQGVGALRLVARGISPTTAQPLRVSDRDLATPEARAAQALAFLPYMLILFSFLGGAYLVIDATAGERERNSLEPLLATPAARHDHERQDPRRLHDGVFSMLLTLAAFKLSFQFAASFGIKLDVSLWTIARILLVLLPMIMIGTCLLTLIAAGAQEREGSAELHERADAAADDADHHADGEPGEEPAVDAARCPSWRRTR
jgi:sodium transport system permease protein